MTAHMALRCDERGIAYESIKEAILHGKIIEQYPADYPYPSCLLVHYIANGICLHVVVGVGENKLWIITAYYPDENKWSNGFIARMGGN
jgi:hypothetical protein